jgi:hypothetical protein
VSAAEAPPPAVVDRSRFEYVRAVLGGGGRPLLVVPDGPLYAHAGHGFDDLRFADARGREVPWRLAPPPRKGALIRRPVRSVERFEDGRRTVVEIDLGYRGVDVDAMRIEAANRRYDRPVRVLGSNGGRPFRGVGAGPIERYGKNPRTAAVPVSSRFRLLRVEIDNGDDPRLRGVRIVPVGDRNGVLVEGGHAGPLVALYGNRGAAWPEYDFGRLPLEPSATKRATAVRLGRERPNPAFVPPRPPPDRRSFLARHRGLLTAALVLAALALALAGAVALRSPRISL